MTSILSLLLVSTPAAHAQSGPVGPAEEYAPLQSGELFGTAHVLQDGGRQIRLSTLSHWGLTDNLQLDVGILGSLVRPQAGVEYLVMDGDRVDLSLAGWGETSWNGSSRTGRIRVQSSILMGEYNRLNVGLGIQQSKIEVEKGTLATAGFFYKGPTELLRFRQFPLTLSFDKVKSDRQVLRFAGTFDAGPVTLGRNPEGDAGVLWNYGWKRFRIGLGGGLRYAPTFGDQANAALEVFGQDPVNVPDVLPKLDLNLWWAF